jgi:hypothetical protein
VQLREAGSGAWRPFFLFGAGIIFFGVGLNRLFVVVVRGRWVLMPV